MISFNSIFANTLSYFNSFKVSLFVDDVNSVTVLIYGIDVKYLVPKNTFLEDMKFS